MVSPSNFDHEKLDVYQLELKFLTWVTQFLAEMLVRIVAILTKLVERFDPYQYRVRECASVN